jgi:hypothetical protein
MRYLMIFALLFQTVPVPKAPTKVLPNPAAAAGNRSLPFSERVNIPKQGWLDALIHGEKWNMAALAFPGNEVCIGKINPPRFIVSTLEGGQADMDIKLDPWGWGEAKDKPKGMGVDVTAPAGRTIFVRWGCPVV